ncbi:MAG: 4-(cytidine 5'-diphospho)-2-C-methyl-D-erythritol kinase [Deltaproteobacteria bacterium]|nr:4-(cytidine 5'-diphospho)-2-C-methyl-D-erythritol kinase [Deltaproteobacteria bacterium]
MKTLKLQSPGKINLRLDVLGKRNDGYHDLRMLNSAVSVYDDIELNIIDRGIVVEVADDPRVPSGEDNIVFRAAKEIMAYSNKNVGVHVRIKKNIPSGAGMGGGSSNAASILAGLNQLLKINLNREKLIRIGLRFGADIPFFLYGSPAIATGIGENLARVRRLPRLPVVIVSPNLSVATKWVFERYQPNGSRHGEMEIPREFATKKAVVKMMNNDLESVTSRLYPVVNDLKDRLVKYGALGAQMTGSGPSVFGIFADEEQAVRAAKKLSQKANVAWRVFIAETI